MADLHLVTGRNGKEHVTAADHGAFHVSVLIGGQFVLNCGNKFAASIVSNNLIKISDGELLMQGRYVRLASGSFIEVPIENGAQDYKRNDLIVVKYTKDATTGAENMCLEVIKGIATTEDAVDPEYTPGNILGGDLEAIFPLYRIPIVGLSVQEPETMFEVLDNFDERLKALGGSKVDKEEGKGLSTNDYSDAEKKKVTDHIADDVAHVTATEKAAWNAKAGGSHTHSKADVGLGNVDNTADSQKSVKYAATAGSAPASDVSSWAKASSKPSYSWSEIGSKPSSFTPSSHNQAASTITAGTLAGKVNANASAMATLTNSQVRDIVVKSSVTEGGAASESNGTIVFTKG